MWMPRVPLSIRWLAVIALLVAVCGVAAVRIQAQVPLYAADQATRGKAQYNQWCASCHKNDLTGADDVPPLVGPVFLDGWRGATLWEFADFTDANMPPNAPGRLTPNQLNEVLAFILQRNNFPSGVDPLNLDLKERAGPIVFPEAPAPALSDDTTSPH